MTKTAKLLKERLEDFTGDANLYELIPPLEYENYNSKGKEIKKKAKYVVVSATIAMFSGPETYIFPATKNGEIISWGELEGSYQGGLSHNEALRNAGYNEIT